MKAYELINELRTLGDAPELTMGHVGSERYGMRLLGDKLAKKHPDTEFKYFENEEV